MDKILYLMIDRPNYINSYNDFIWLNSLLQEYRNYNLPSFVSRIYNIYWRINNKLHRENNKPAFISKSDNRKSYWMYGKLIKIEQIK